MYPVLPSYKLREMEREELFPLPLSPSLPLPLCFTGSPVGRRRHTGLIPVCGSRVTLTGCIFTKRASPGPKICLEPSPRPISSWPERMMTNWRRGADASPEICLGAGCEGNVRGRQTCGPL